MEKQEEEKDGRRTCSHCGTPLKIRYIFGEKKRIYTCPKCNKKVEEQLD